MSTIDLAPEATSPAPSPGGRYRTRSRRGLATALIVVLGLVGGVLGANVARSLTAHSVDVTDVGTRVSAAIVDITTTLPDGTAAGTGMVLTSSGQVLTNNHVIAGATSIRAQVDGTGRVYTAKVLGYDVADDVALLQLEGASGLKTVSLGRASAPSVGETVLVAGNAGGRGGPPTVTQGTISALDQTLTAADDIGSPETLSGMIQIDAPIEAGDSGGALVDGSGKVIGITTAAARGFRMSVSNVGFAIPINTAMSIVGQIQSGRFSTNVHLGSRGLLGVEVASQASPFGSGFSSDGAVVRAVQSQSPAAAAGLVAGDVIDSVNGRTITSGSDLTSVMNATHSGDKVVVMWLDRSGARHRATVSLAEGAAA